MDRKTLCIIAKKAWLIPLSQVTRSRFSGRLRRAAAIADGQGQDQRWVRVSALSSILSGPPNFRPAHRGSHLGQRDKPPKSRLQPDIAARRGAPDSILQDYRALDHRINRTVSIVDDPKFLVAQSDCADPCKCSNLSPQRQPCPAWLIPLSQVTRSRFSGRLRRAAAIADGQRQDQRWVRVSALSSILSGLQIFAQPIVAVTWDNGISHCPAGKQALKPPIPQYTTRGTKTAIGTQ